MRKRDSNYPPFAEEKMQHQQLTLWKYSTLRTLDKEALFLLPFYNNVKIIVNKYLKRL